MVADVSQRFIDLMRVPEVSLPLDEAALLIAAHRRPDLDVGGQIARLDQLASSCEAGDLGAWRRHLFEDLGFSGNVADYYDPDNSYLDQVMDRRVGLPISLAVLGMEVGRRLGLNLAGVAMPGHFLLTVVGSVPRVWIDPFAGGRLLDRGDCEEQFHQVNGDGAVFRESYLDTVGPKAILARMLANLKAIYASRGDVEALAWIFALRLSVPGVHPIERRELAQALGSSGRFVEAAEELEVLAETLPDRAPELLSEALGLRARLN